MRSASATSVGAGRAGGGSKAPRPSAGGARQRKTGGGSSGRSTGGGGVAATAGGGTMWRFYTGDDSPGIKIGPVPVLVLSLLFIATVFLLHIWGKYSRR